MASIFIRRFPVELYQQCHFVQLHDEDGDVIPPFDLIPYLDPSFLWKRLNPIKLFKKKDPRKKRLGIPAGLIPKTVTAGPIHTTTIIAAIESECEPLINYGKVIPIPDPPTIHILDGSRKLTEITNGVNN